MTQRIALFGVVLAIGAGALWWWFSYRNPAAWRPALSSRQIAMRVMGEYLVRRYPGATALVVGNPFTQRSGQSPEIYAFERAAIRGLEQGFGSPEAIKVVHPILRPEFLQRPESVFVDPRTTTPLSFLVTDDAFDLLIQTNASFELVVSLIGLPVHLTQRPIWAREKPRFGLLLPDWRTLGSLETVREAFKTGKIAAAVVARPGTEPDDKVITDDHQGEFSRRFLLVTSENFEELLQTHPQLF